MDVIGMPAPMSVLGPDQDAWTPTENPRRFFDELAPARLFVPLHGADVLWEEESFLGGSALAVFFDMPDDVEPTEIAQVSCDQLYRMTMGRPDAHIWLNPDEEVPFFCVTMAGLGALARGENPVNLLGAWFFVDPSRNPANTVQTIALPEGVVRKNRPTAAKTKELLDLLDQSDENRSESWLERFREAVLDAIFVHGPAEPALEDGFPYLVLKVPSEADKSGTSLIEELEKATNQGCGIRIEYQRNAAPPLTDTDAENSETGRYLISFGELLSLRQFHAFQAPRPLASMLVDPQPLADYFIGQPPINILPGYALDALENYLAKETGKDEVAVSAMAQPKEDGYLRLVVPISPVDFAMPEFFERANRGIAWYLPESYSYVTGDFLDKVAS